LQLQRYLQHPVDDAEQVDDALLVPVALIQQFSQSPFRVQPMREMVLNIFRFRDQGARFKGGAPWCQRRLSGGFFEWVVVVYPIAV